MALVKSAKAKLIKWTIHTMNFSHKTLCSHLLFDGSAAVTVTADPVSFRSCFLVRIETLETLETPSLDHVFEEGGASSLTVRKSTLFASRVVSR